MGNLWTAFWDLIYNALVNAVSLNWSALVQIGADIRAWWDTLWLNIVGIRNALESLIAETKERLTYRIQDYYGYALDAIALVEAWVLEQIQAVMDWVQATLADLGDYVAPYIDAVKTWVLDLLQGWLDSALAFINPYIEAAKTWVTDTFGWLLDSYTLFTEWLAGVRDAVTWLATQAWTSLTSFLADPFNFVLGLLAPTIINVINWWLTWAQTLDDFLALDLPRLRNFLALGLDFLLTFMASPLQTILDLLYPVFLDWLEQLIADAW